MNVRIGLLASVALIAAAAGAAHAADLVIEEVAVAPVATDWSGPYVGAHIGVGGGQIGDQTSIITLLAVPGEDDRGYDLSGWLAGVQAGGYLQFGSFVLGLQGDVSWSNLSGPWTDDGDEYPGDTATIDWLASLTARGGVAFDNVLLYGLAGLAMAGGSSDYYGDVQDLNFAGITLGVGAALKLDENWSVFAEYAYSTFGDIDVYYPVDDFTATYDLDISTIKVGLNYSF